MKRTWRNTIWAVSAAALLLAGCANGKTGRTAADGGAAATSSPVSSVSPSASPSAKPSEQEQTIRAYFADEAGNKLVQTDVKIRYAADKDKYLAALNALKTSSDSKLIPLASGLTFKSATEKDGNLVVDLSISKNGQLGSNGEALLLSAIKQTLFQYSELKTIDLLVDGQKVESMMGHMDLPHPMKR